MSFFDIYMWHRNKMIHKMNLWNDSFNKIKDKTKTIEMRLCDEKRSII